MAKPSGSIKKIRTTDNTDHDIIPDAVGNGSYKASCPSLTQDETLATESYVNQHGGGGGGITLTDVYPVGAIYVSIDSTSPASLFGGTWSEISAGNALWTTATSSADAGGTISAGLPNIKGSVTLSNVKFNATNYYQSGAMGWKSGNYSYYNSVSSETSSGNTGIEFNANSYNSIYNDSTTTVQPPAYKVYAWQRIS